MKQLLLIGALLLLAVSCGKGNNNSVADNSVASVTPQYSGTIVGGATFEAFKAEVNAGHFYPQPSYENVHRYYYFDPSKSSSNCHTTGGFFKITTCSGTSQVMTFPLSRRSTLSTGTIQHELGTTYDAVRNGIMTILNNADYPVRVTDTYYRVQTTDGDIYEINLNYPLIANPVAHYNASSNNYFYATYLAY